MRIRTQIVVAVVPLFFGMTLVTGALTYSLQVKELAGGLREESSSIALAAAQLADVETVQRLAAGAAPAENPVRGQFRAILRWGRARRLTLLAGDGRRVLLDAAEAGAAGPPLSVPPPAAAALAREPFAVGSPRREPGGGTFLSAYAPVRDAAGTLLGIVAVETRVDSFTAQRAAIVESALISLCAASLLGLVLAVLISTAVTRRLSRLTRAVHRVEEAGDGAAAGGVIEEVNDLVNTFATMKSVLGDVLARSNRARVEAEQFRTEDDLAQAFREEFQQARHREIAGMVVAGTVLGSQPAGSFFGMWEVPGGGCAFVGTVSEAGTLEQSVVAAAALAYLEQASRAGTVAPALASFADLFPLIQGEGVAWRRGADGAVRWTLDWGAGVWREEPVAAPAGATVILQTLGAPVGRRIGAYAAQYGRIPPEALLKEIPGIVDENLSGAVVLLRRGTAAGAPEP
jgi:HAMP domain-containing protein